MRIAMGIVVVSLLLAAKAHADELNLAQPAPRGHVGLVVGLGAPTGLIGAEAAWRPLPGLELVGGIGESTSGATVTGGVRGMLHRGRLAFGVGAGVSFGDTNVGVLEGDLYHDAVMPYAELHLRAEGRRLFVDLGVGAFMVASQSSYEHCPFLEGCRDEAAPADHPIMPSASLTVGAVF